MAATTAPLPVITTSSSSVSRALTTGILLGLASAVMFSTSGPFVKPLLEAGWSLGAVLLVRMGLAGLILSPALVRAMRRDRGFLRRHWLLICGFGLTGVAGCQIFFFAAMQRMPVAIALLIQYLAPVLLVLLAWARTRRAPSALVIAGSVIAIAGLVLVVDISGATFDLLGSLLALIAAACAGAYFLFADRAGGDVPPLALASGGLVVGTIVVGLLAAVGILPVIAFPVDVVLGSATVPWFVPLLWVGAIGTTLGYGLGVIAVPRMGSRIASFVGLTEVLGALAFAWLLLGEAPVPIQFAGGALILVGVVLVRLDANGRTAVTRKRVRTPVAPNP